MMKYLSRWMAGASLCALTLASIGSAHAQEGSQLIRIAAVELKSGGQFNFNEAVGMVNAAAKKSGTPWRESWRTTIFGETNTVYLVAPVANMAMFDGQPATASMTSEERAKYTTLTMNSVENVRYRLSERMPDLSLRSGRTAPPKFARVTVVKVTPGKQQEFEGAIRTILLPAFKKAGVKDYWVTRTILGGAVGEYITVLLFDKWAETDSLISPEKMMGPEVFKQYLAKVAGSVLEAENSVVQYDEALSYRQ